MTATVYVPQESVRRNENGDFEPTYDLSPALAFGDIVVLASSMPIGVDPQPMLQSMRQKLRDFNDQDFIVAMGDPSAIAAASMIASALNHGRVKMLRWDRRTKSYLVVQLDVR